MDLCGNMEGLANPFFLLFFFKITLGAPHVASMTSTTIIPVEGPEEEKKKKERNEIISLGDFLP